MKGTLLLLILVFISTYINAQIGFEDHIIIDNTGGTNGAYRAYSVFSIDIDGDGDQDVLSASTEDDKIAWYENTDGAGTFGPPLIITTNADYAVSVRAADLDGDGDIDVLSGSINDNKIAWYENTDGLGTFGNQQIISSTVPEAAAIRTADMDGDGDLDVIAGANSGNEIFWFENLNSQGSFGSQQIITSDVLFPESIDVIDLDGDGDIDVLSASWGDDKIAWYENMDGQGNFGPQQIISIDVSAAQGVFATDIDGDGDMDVISSSYGDDKVAWYENTDGQGNFGSQQIITSDANGAWSVHANDLDGDGDMDIVASLFQENKIVWFENTDGHGNFNEQQTVSEDGNVSVYTSDIDNDGDIDIVSAHFSRNQVTWHENLGFLALHENNHTNSSLYPNPSDGVLNITSEIGIVAISIYNELGQLVMEENDSERIQKININKLNQGIYFVKIEDLNSNSEVQKILKK